MSSKRSKPTANGLGRPTRPAHTAKDLARYKAIRERFQQEKPSLEELVSSGEYNEPLPMGEYLSIRQAVFALKEAREAARLSLADLAERTGIDKGALSRIETGQHPNPTVSTLCRYAHALGKRWKWILESEAVPGKEATTGARRALPTRSREKECPRWTLDAILDLLSQWHQRATYGAVGGVLGVRAAFVMQGRPRDPRHSWVVNQGTRDPTGYIPAQCDPQLSARNTILNTDAALLAWLNNPVQLP